MKYLLVLALMTSLAVMFYTVYPSNKAPSAPTSDQENAAQRQDAATPLTREASAADASDAAAIQSAPSFDCSDECIAFKQDLNRYTYCRSVCGLSLTEAESLVPVQPTDPELKQDLARKDQAVKEHNLAGCEEITDESLRKSCQVRVTEDLLE